MSTDYTAENIPDGLHLGLPEEIYHAIPALSASGLKNLLISAPDFWARSYMNPAREEDEGGGGKDDWRIVGKAFHARILEGREIFAKRFALEFMPPKDCLKTVEDIKTALKALGIKATGNKPDLIAALLLAEPGALIYDVLAEQYAEDNKSKILIPHDLLAKIEISAAMIERHPQIKKCFVGGFPEVTLIWTQEIWIEGNGVPARREVVRFKCRYDYLKPAAIIDLKTFSNIQEKSIDDAIYGAIASKKYHIQASFYLDSVPMLKDAIKEGRIFSTVGYLEDRGHTRETLGGWLSDLLETQEHDFYFVFQQKGAAPLARCKKFTRGQIYRMACVQISDAISRFIQYRATYGNDYWVDQSEIEDLDDLLFPSYIGRL